jgi:hypothetical protein
LGHEALKHRLTAVQRLDLGLLVQGQNDSVLRRPDVQAHDVAHFGHEVWIGGKLERLHPARWSPKARQMRCTVDTDRPLAFAAPRELQWVAFSGQLSSVLMITASIRASSIVRGAPERRS